MQADYTSTHLADLESAIDRYPLTVTADTLMSEAIALMSQPARLQNEAESERFLKTRQSSCILVVKAEKIVGLLTERDIVRLVAKETTFEGLKIGDVMTQQVIALTLTAAQDISTALKMMRHHKIRHLPIVDDYGKLIGIVSPETLCHVLEPSNLLKLRCVEEAMVHQTIEASATTSVLQLCKIMYERQSSCVVVVETQEKNRHIPIGIITERDIVQYQRLEIDLANSQAQSVMSCPLVCVNPSDSLWDVRQQMERLRVRRLVVTGDRNELLGLITQTSLFQSLGIAEVYNAMDVLKTTIDEQTRRLTQINEQLQDEIVERQLLEQNLHEKEARLRGIFTAINDLILIIEVQEDAIGNIEIMPTKRSLDNEKFSDIIEQTIAQLHQSHNNHFRRAIVEALTAQQTVSCEYQLTSDKTEFWLTANIVPISEKSVIWVARDITKPKQTEESLRHSENRFRTLVNNLPGAVYRYTGNNDNAMEFVSQAIETIAGYRASDYVNDAVRDLASIVYFLDRERWEKYLRQALSLQEPYALEYRIVNAFGDLRWVSEIGQGVFTEEGELLYRDGMIFDISDRKQAEEELNYRLTYEQLIATLSTYFINLPSDKTESGLKYALQGVSRFFGFDRSYIFLLGDPSCKKVTQIHEWSASEIASRSHHFQNLVFERGKGAPWWVEQICQHKIVWSDYPEKLSATLQIPLNASEQLSLIALPIVYQDTLIGAVKFHSSRNQKARLRNKLPLLKFFTQMLANIIERKRAEEQRKRIERELFQEKELAQVTLKSIGDAVITTDASGKIEYCNSIAENLIAWKGDEVKGLFISEVFSVFHEETRQPIQNPVERVLQEGSIVNAVDRTILVSRDGSEYAIDESAAPIRDRNGHLIGVVLIFRDVTESRLLSNQLSWQASHDSLTGLVNRRKFEQELIEAIATAQYEGQQHALCYLDLDQFKVVNDTCGHVAGDELLRQVTYLLQQRVRSSDVLARLGGDEFGLLLYNCSLAKAQQIAETIRELIQDFRFTWDGKTFAIGVSIGLAIVDADSEDLNNLLGAVDAACYAAKGNGRNCVHLYRLDDRELVKQRSERRWIAKINQALEDNRFCLYCQKIIPLDRQSREIHYEILLRMIDEKGNLVSPMAFIPAAERYDLMPAIDRWVIGTFLSGYESYYSTAEAKSEGVYTINLSGASVNNPQFCSFLVEQIASSPIPSQKICFEITETTAIANLKRAANLIESLKQLGCRFALDDFGSGMSSLAYLKNLPVDYLKIDGSFVKNIVSDPIDRVMVESLNQISHVMGIQTIAEFVEDRATLIELQEIGVDYAQGYGIGKPRPCPFNTYLEN
jgi:diguanylate cyclase (GGDEF)-like protein/PAS domain S-box-containing protein